MNPPLLIPESEIIFTAIRAQGAGGQNVNKVSNAVHLRFDIRASSLPEAVKERLLALRDQRISDDGAILIKAQRFRSLELNRRDAIRRLHELVDRAATPPTIRRPTRPTLGAKKRRLESKARRGEIKNLRRRTQET